MVKFYPYSAKFFVAEIAAFVIEWFKNKQIKVSSNMNRQTETILRGGQFKQLMELHYATMKKEYQLKRIELEILYCLSKCGEHNTSTNIREYLRENKGHISQAIDSLCRNNYLTAVHDKEDRRYIHYTLTPKANDVIRNMNDTWKQLNKEIFDGISKEELQAFQIVAKKIARNMDKIIEKNTI